MSEADWQDVDIQIDLADLLPLVARSLYPRADAAVRELLANAVDALTRKDDVIRANPGMYPEDLEISVNYDVSNYVLTVADTGCGMAWDDVIKYVNHIGRSGTELMKDEFQNRELIKQLIGQFGIGLLAAFKLGQPVTIRTRALDAAADEAVEWRATGTTSKAQMRKISRDKPGSEIAVAVALEHREMLLTGLKECVSDYGDLLPYPIYDAYRELLNSYGKVPWYKDDQTEEDYREYIVSRHKGEPINPPLWVIPITPRSVRLDGENIPVDCRGVIYIPDDRSFINLHGNADLYSRSMLVRKERPGILPEHVLFCEAIVDGADLSMVMNREDVMEDRAFRAMQVAVAEQLYAGLGELVKKPKEWRRVQSTFERELKAGVVKDDGVFKAVADHLVFFIGAGERQSLGQYMQSAQSRGLYDEQKGEVVYQPSDLTDAQRETLAALRKTLIFISSASGPARYQMDQLLLARGLRAIEVLPEPSVDEETGAVVSRAERSLDWQVLNKYAQANNLELKAAGELVEKFPEMSDPKLERVAEVFRTALHSGERGMTVRISAFHPDGLPALLDFPTAGRAREQVQEWRQALEAFIEQHQDAPRGLQQVIRMAEAQAAVEDRTATLVVNAKNDTIQQLADALDDPKFRSLDRTERVTEHIAIELYHAALQQTGYQPDDRNMSAILAARCAAVEQLLSLSLQVASTLPDGMAQ